MGSGWAVRTDRTACGKEPAPGYIRLAFWAAQPTVTPSLPRFGQNASERLLATVLQVNLTHDADFGVFACWVSNATATFTLQRRGRDTLGASPGGDRSGKPKEGSGNGVAVVAPWVSRSGKKRNGCMLRCELRKAGSGLPAMLTMLFTIFAEVVGHVSAVLAALLVLALLVLLAGLYIRCRLSVLLWYRNHYGELEMNGERGVEERVAPG